MLGVLVVAIVNVFLAVLMIGVYLRIYGKRKAPFTLGLIAFAGALLLQNMLVAYKCGTMMPLFPDAVAPYMFGIGFLEAAGLAALAWTTML